MERHMLDYRRLLEAGEWWVRAITGRERRATSGRKLAAVAELVTILAERRTETRTRAAWVYGRERGCASWTVTRPADVCGADASDLAPNLRAQWDAWEGELAAANRAAYAEAAAWAETAAWPTAAASALTEGYVRKGGSNAEKSQIQTRPAGPASMNPGGAAPPNVRRHRSCGF